MNLVAYDERRICRASPLRFRVFKHVRHPAEKSIHVFLHVSFNPLPFIITLPQRGHEHVASSGGFDIQNIMNEMQANYEERNCKRARSPPAPQHIFSPLEDPLVIKHLQTGGIVVYNNLR